MDTTIIVDLTWQKNSYLICTVIWMIEFSMREYLKQVDFTPSTKHHTLKIHLMKTNSAHLKTRPQPVAPHSMIMASFTSPMLAKRETSNVISMFTSMDAGSQPTCGIHSMLGQQVCLNGLLPMIWSSCSLKPRVKLGMTVGILCSQQRSVHRSRLFKIWSRESLDANYSLRNAHTRIKILKPRMFLVCIRKIKM